MSEESQNLQDNQHKKLRLGEFIVKQKDNKDLFVQPLTQEEIASGWRMNLPHTTKKITKHHFNINLSQLPPYLWQKMDFDTKITNENCYPTINDNIYYYSVKQTKNDDKLRELYTELYSKKPNKSKVSELYDFLLDHHTKGWIMIKAQQFL
jgi:hypothetical protein